jgi:hypothetical protein
MVSLCLPKLWTKFFTATMSSTSPGSASYTTNAAHTTRTVAMVRRGSDTLTGLLEQERNLLALKIK